VLLADMLSGWMFCVLESVRVLTLSLFCVMHIWF